jgi:hypothetical protein
VKYGWGFIIKELAHKIREQNLENQLLFVNDEKASDCMLSSKHWGIMKVKRTLVSLVRAGKSQ